jgi:hypothetical protein
MKFKISCCWLIADTDNLIVTEVPFSKKQNFFNALISKADWSPASHET